MQIFSRELAFAKYIQKEGPKEKMNQVVANVIRQHGLNWTIASIAAFDRAPKILLSAVANHGNSGSPIFNDRGKVLGLLEGEIPGQQQERTGLEYVVPAFFVEKLMRDVEQSHTGTIR